MDTAKEPTRAARRTPPLRGIKGDSVPKLHSADAAGAPTTELATITLDATPTTADTQDVEASAALARILEASPALSRLSALVGGVRGESIAQALVPLALVDLAQRAAATHGRDADRLWSPILTYAKPAASVQVTVPVQVNLYEGGMRARIRAHEATRKDA